MEEAGAVYGQDDTMAEFCACVDSHCPRLDWDDDDIFMCGNCERDDEVNVEVGVDVGCDSDMFDFVCRIDDAEGDEFATADYKSLRVVDGWQRRDPWGGSSESRPKRFSVTSTPTHIIPTLSSTSSSLYTSAMLRPHQGLQYSMSSGRRFLPLMMAG